MSLNHHYFLCRQGKNWEEERAEVDPRPALQRHEHGHCRPGPQRIPGELVVLLCITCNGRKYLSLL